MVISLNPYYKRKTPQPNCLQQGFIKYIMGELNDLKNRLDVFSTLGSASYSYEAIAIPKEELQFLREHNINKSIILQNLTESEYLVLRNKDERNIPYNAYVNDNKSNFPSDEIYIPYSKIFEMPKNARNEKETSNVKLTNPSRL